MCFKRSTGGIGSSFGMQALTLPQAVTCRACGSRRAHLQSLAAPARPARRPHGGYRAASAFAGAAAAFSSEPDYLGGLASAVGLLLAGGLAWTLAQVRSASQAGPGGCWATGWILSAEACACSLMWACQGFWQAWRKRLRLNKSASPARNNKGAVLCGLWLN